MLNKLMWCPGNPINEKAQGMVKVIFAFSFLARDRNMNSILFLTVQSYRVLWTGLGAQLARDVPFSAICWSTLEPVRYHLFLTFQCIHMVSCFLLLLHVNPTYLYFLLLLCGDPEKNSWTGGWSSQCSQHPWGKLFCWFCGRKSCSCCYMSTRCGKNPKADRGFFSKPSFIYLHLPLLS